MTLQIKSAENSSLPLWWRRSRTPSSSSSFSLSTSLRRLPGQWASTLPDPTGDRGSERSHPEMATKGRRGFSGDLLLQEVVFSHTSLKLGLGVRWATLHLHSNDRRKGSCSPRLSIAVNSLAFMKNVHISLDINNLHMAASSNAAWRREAAAAPGLIKRYTRRNKRSCISKRYGSSTTYKIWA